MAPRSTWQAQLQHAWNRRGALACALWPVAAVFASLSAVRRSLYRIGLCRSTRLPVPVVVVGNVVAGGAGKTPTVIALVQYWQDKGLSVGIVSRGYGRQARTCQAVSPQSTPAEVGDEPLLIHLRTHAPVWVGLSRVQAAQALLQAHPKTQIIVCDDGLQHYALCRDLEICVFDNRGTGNGWPLPAGPLREPWPRKPLLRVGAGSKPCLVVHTGSQPAFSGFQAQRYLASYALDAEGRPHALNQLAQTGNKPLAAVAGIAQPEAFFHMLRSSGLLLAYTQALPDHYDFDSFPRNMDADFQLICTEKDARKLWLHAPHALAVPLQQNIEPAFWQALDAATRPLISSPLSSPHGHTTT